MEAMHEESLAVEEHGFSQIGGTLPELVKELALCDRKSALAAVAGLTLLHENRIHLVRLECLLHLIAIHSNGKDLVTVELLDRWLNQLLERSALRRREDPAEDIAIANIMTDSGNYRVFTGDWSNPDYYLQDMLDALRKGPASLDVLREHCLVALKVSDLISDRMGYSRLTGNSEAESAPVSVPISDQALLDLSRRAIITFDEMGVHGIDFASLAPFCIPLTEFCQRARDANVKNVRQQPFVILDGELIVTNPAALPMSIVMHILSEVRDLGLLRGLANSLHRVQGPRTLRELTRGISTGDFLTSLLPEQKEVLRPGVSQTAFRFDEDKFLHILFLHDDVNEIAQNGPSSVWSPPFRDMLDDFVIASCHRFLEEGRCRGGLTLVVIGGVWRGCAIALPTRLPPQCAIQVWSSADLDRLIVNEHRWKLLLWKMSMQRRALEELGVRVEAHSDANLYSMWTHHDFRLVPRDQGDGLFNLISYGPEFIFALRNEHRSGMDDHVIYRPDRATWERVRKVHTRSHFHEDSTRRTYAALCPVEKGVLGGAIETADRAWWVDCSTSASHPDRRRLVYDLWESALNWVEKVAPALDRQVPELGGQNVIFDLDVSQIVAHENWTPEGVQEIKATGSIPMRIAGRIISLRLPIGLLAMAYSAKNNAERLLVSAFVESALTLARVKDLESRAAQILASLALSDDDRFMHLIPAHDVRDYLRVFDNNLPELLHDDEIAFGTINTAQEAGLKVPSRIDAVESANSALNKLVDALWKRVHSRLGEIDRVNFIVKCLQNHERLLYEHDRWQRTARALFSLHKDRVDVLKATQAVQEKRDRTQIVDRILIEMAVCTSPLKDGRRASQADIDYLATQVLLLVATAAHSDAVRAGCTEPSMRISELGEFTFGDNFVNVMRPYIASHFERTHITAIKNYGELFSPRSEGTKTEEEVFGHEFVESFTEEFGINPSKLKELAGLLQESAIERRSLVVVEDADSFAKRLTGAGFTSAEVGEIRHNFLLKPREQWDSAPKPFRNKDWHPWRYRRRLSLMTRPIVEFGDRRLVYAPGFCEDSFRHTIMESFTGAFETEYFDTTRMKRYAGAANARRGIEFNQAVADLFSEQDWNVRLEVAMTELEAAENQAKGDVDVLAWKKDVVCVCECKELLFARNVSEVAEQLKRFRGAPGDDLDKHLRRTHFITSHPDKLLRITGIQNPRVVPLLVTSKVVPMQFVRTVATQVVSADQVTSDFLASLLGSRSK
ncbi:MAG TPA: hypothetical protein VN577_23045 [Terriglobales bacterium]|nr:hypothetical protein [Terriglobales bacterium]